MERRKLALSREVLAELSHDDLRAVVAAGEVVKVNAHVPVNEADVAHTVKCLLQGCTCYCA